MISESDPKHDCASSTRGTWRGSPGGSAYECARPVVGTAVNNRGHAAALSDGHVSQTPIGWPPRVRGARRPRDIRSAGTASRCRKVRLVRCLSSKRRMRKHVVVFVDVERHQPPDGRDAIERMEEELLMSSGNAKRL